MLVSASSKTCSSKPGRSSPRPLDVGEMSGLSSRRYGFGSDDAVFFDASVVPDDMERRAVGEGGVDMGDPTMVVVTEAACLFSAHGARGAMLGTAWCSGP